MNDIWNSKPWMKAIDVDLLFRLWERKDYPGKFTYNGIIWKAQHTDYGVIIMHESPLFKDLKMRCHAQVKYARLKL